MKRQPGPGEGVEEEEPDRSLNALSRDVIGAGIRVHKELGPGLLERAYRECLAEALQEDGFDVTTEVVVPVRFEGRELDAYYRADVVVNNEIVVEVKAVDEVLPVHGA